MDNDNLHTIEYYERNASKYIHDTYSLDLSSLRSRFLSRIEPGGRILDVGCGSGRDLVAFAVEGYSPIGVEPALALATYARMVSGCEVIQSRLEEARLATPVDGAWACASLLHIQRLCLHESLRHLASLVRPRGILYSSFKYGECERREDGRYYNDLTETSARIYFVQASGWLLDDVWVSRDLTRSSQRWLNVLACRCL